MCFIAHLLLNSMHFLQDSPGCVPASLYTASASRHFLQDSPSCVPADLYTASASRHFLQDSPGCVPASLYIASVSRHFIQDSPGCVPASLYTASASRLSSSGSHLPELHMSLIRRHLSFTDDALRPIADPIFAQSLPWIVRNLGA